MKISDFIKKLNKAKKECGDVDVWVFNDNKKDLNPTIVDGFSPKTKKSKCIVITGSKSAKLLVEVSKEMQNVQ